MTVSYKTSPEGYVAYLVDLSKNTTFGKMARKRFYIGFTLIYLILWVAIFFYILTHGQLPAPYFIMGIVIYAVMVVYMKFVDIHEVGAIRRAEKDIYNKTIELDKQIDIEISDQCFTVATGKESVNYRIENMFGISNQKDFIIIYTKETKSYVIPKEILSEKEIDYLLILLPRIGRKNEIFIR